MKYALLIYSQPGSHEALGEEEYRAALGDYMALSEHPGCVSTSITPGWGPDRWRLRGPLVPVADY